jgi:predicted DsbA family dithiol-disulfide isomerase
MLITIAKNLGMDTVAFKKCLDSGKYAGKVQDDYNDAIASGGTGTPHSVIVTKDGQKLPLSGAQPLASVTAVIEGLLKAQ